MANEKRLIDANALLAKMRKTSRYFSIKFDIEEAPTVDAVEVVHGRWEWKPQNEMIWQLRCSVCGSEDGANETYNYCPNCGAKMDGERKDNG